MPIDEYRHANLANWEERVGIHAASRDYNLAAFVSDPTRLSDVVRYEQARLGALDGLDVVHLQCHIGTDTVSLARLGARSVTGLDFSPRAIATARRLAHNAGAAIKFVESELYDAPAALAPDRFDLVYTGVGALNWLPSITEWAGVVAAVLRPGGRLFLRDGHPMLYALDDERDDEQLVVTQPYFELVEPSRWENDTTYTDGDVTLANTTNYEWNHGIGEVVQAVIDAGLVVTQLVEHREMPWKFFSWMTECPGQTGHWVLPNRVDLVPLMYTLQASKPAEDQPG